MSIATELRLATRPAWLAALLASLERLVERRALDHDERGTLRSLAQLDERTLRDIGLDASELSSVAHELSQRTDATRWHAWSQFRGYC